MPLVTFTKDVHAFDDKQGIDTYHCFNDTTEVSDEELAVIDDYAKKRKLDEVYVKGAKDLIEDQVGPRADSPSVADDKDASNKDATPEKPAQ